MQKNPHYDLLGKERILDVYRSWGLSFADDKIVDELITLAWYYNGPQLPLQEKFNKAMANNPRCTLIKGAITTLKEEIEVALARAIEEKRK